MTFTILALDSSRRAIGVAAASCSLAVGASVPALDPRIGAVASQAWTNPGLRGKLLAELTAGTDPARAAAMVERWDSQPELRQVGVLGANGAGGAFTGSGTSPWQGHVVRTGCVVLGNCLAGPEVLEEMLRALGEPAGVDELAAALVAALTAGEAAGGDVRGRQSAVVLAGELSGEAAEYDLRVDDHGDPLAQLKVLVGLRRAARSGLSAPRP